MLPPTGCRPCSLAKLAIATWPMALDCWLLKLANITPLSSMVRLEMMPVAYPSWLCEVRAVVAL
ncbi:hypothetical protein D3C71_1837060 [compost metagenome]